MKIKMAMALVAALLALLLAGPASADVIYRFSDGTVLYSYESPVLIEVPSWQPRVHTFSTTSSVPFGGGDHGWVTSSTRFGRPAAEDELEVGIQIGNTRMWTDRRGRFRTSISVR
jgi:hypothetical protein